MPSEQFLEAARELCTEFNNKVVEAEREIATGELKPRLLTEDMRIKEVFVSLAGERDVSWENQILTVRRLAVQATRGAKPGSRPTLIPNEDGPWTVMYVPA
jgi:hypothetical protein